MFAVGAGIFFSFPFILNILSKLDYSVWNQVDFLKKYSFYLTSIKDLYASFKKAEDSWEKTGLCQITLAQDWNV